MQWVSGRQWVPGGAPEIVVRCRKQVKQLVCGGAGGKLVVSGGAGSKQWISGGAGGEHLVSGGAGGKLWVSRS